MVRPDTARAGELAKLLFVAAFFSCAWLLSPRAAGFGTHRALGLPPCPFPSLLGLPCATCGLTTACVELVHLHFDRALRAQPLAVALCFALVLQGVLSALRLAGRAARGDPLQLLWQQRTFVLALLTTTWLGRVLGLVL